MLSSKDLSEASD